MAERVGLTLGKYAPLHRGHQLMIETALAEMDHVIIVIYDCPDTTDVPLPVRAGWLRELYPEIEVIKAWDGPLEVGDTPEIKARHEAYLLNLLRGRRITHFYSSEFYGDHVSKAIGAVDRRVDPDRLAVPISGTEIRENPFSHRAYLDARVYRHLITNVVFLGAPSTGKTTLAESLAARYRTQWMPEYGRDYWEAHQVDRRLTLEQLVEIAEGHIEREDALVCDCDRYLFTDTNALTTAIFSMYYHGRVHPRLAELADAAAGRYDVVFLCGDDIPYDDTWDRSGEVNRADFQCWIVEDLERRGIPYSTVRGNIEERVAFVGEVLEGYRKYASR